MTPDPRDRRAQRLRAVAVGGTLLFLCVILLLVSPVGDGNDQRLTTTRYGPRSARLAYDLPARVGYRSEQVMTPLRGRLDSTVTYVLADGEIPMPAEDRRAVLEAVRRGAGLVLMQGNSAPALFDSLGVNSNAPIGRLDTVPTRDCRQGVAELRRLGLVSMLRTFELIQGPDSQLARRAPRDTTHFVTVGVRMPFRDVGTEPFTEDTEADREDDDDTPAGDLLTERPDSGLRLTMSDSAKRANRMVVVRRPAMLGFPLGRGRVVVLADADMLRTDELRECVYGHAPRYLAALQWVTTGRSRVLRFAEYYQAERTDGPMATVGAFLVRHPVGRALLLLGVAGLVWVLARGRRTLAPVDLASEERRSALEHVDALALAWRAVRGTRTVARQLTAGLRRRHASGTWRTLTDDEFLAVLAQRHPAIAADADRLTRALATPVAPDELPDLRAAAARIDAACLSP